jgi:hypothetical protein
MDHLASGTNFPASLISASGLPLSALIKKRNWERMRHSKAMKGKPDISVP